MPTHGGIKHKFSPGQLSNADLRRDVFTASLCGENVFRTDPKDNRFTLVTLRIQYGQLVLRDLQAQRFRHKVAVVDRATNEVHRRRTNKPCNEHIRRLVVDLLRRTHLLNDAVL